MTSNNGLTIRNSQSVDRDIMATDADGNAVQVAMVSARIQPGKALSFSVNVIKPELAQAHADEMGAFVDGFIAEVRALAGESGIPVQIASEQ